MRDGNTIAGYRVATRTDVGKRRERNEDFVSVEDLGGDDLLVVVADGMGGHRGGQRASSIASETLIDTVRGHRGDRRQALVDGLAAANRAVLAEAERDPELRGMGTTVVAALLLDNRALVLNLGDSRAYHLRKENGGPRLTRVTDDHSLVGEMVRRGELTEAEAAEHPRRNVITRAIGIAAEPQPELYEVELDQEDRLLLCTDGLHGMIPDREIAMILGADWGLDAVCDSLVDAALDAGGNDNVTVAVLRRVAPAPKHQAPPGRGLGTGSRESGGSVIREGKRSSLAPMLLLLVVAGAIAAWYFLSQGDTRGGKSPYDSLAVETARGGSTFFTVPDSLTFEMSSPDSLAGHTVLDGDTGASQLEQALEPDSNP